MKVIIEDGSNFVLRFDKGDDVISGLANFMKEQAIFTSSFQGLGACSEVELAFFNPHIKDYRKKPFMEEMEVVSLIGNGSLKDGVPIIHCHGVFGRNDFTLIGGHVFRLIVSVTVEVSFKKIEGAAQRVMNPDFNLNLLS